MKERFLKNNVFSITPEKVISAQSEIKNLSEDYSRYHAYSKGAKVRFINVATKAITNHNTIVATPSQTLTTHDSSSARPEVTTTH